jgi:RNA polymerase sigma factor (sigma-70 family)
MANQHPIPENRNASSAPRYIRGDGIPALFAVLGNTPEKSGMEYERLRSKLILFFSRRELQFPEDLADESLDRLARRVAEGTEIVSVPAFALGIARHLAQEQMGRRNLPQTMDDVFWDNVTAPLATQSSEEEIARMERCLKKLPPADTRLLRGYYLLAEGKPMETRGRLAERLGISTNTLRQRVFLARQRLRDCMTAGKAGKR